MVECPVCGGRVSQWAVVCPYCAADLAHAELLTEADRVAGTARHQGPRRGWSWITSAVIALGAVVAASLTLSLAGDRSEVGKPASVDSSSPALGPAGSETISSPTAGLIAHVDDDGALRVVDLGDGSSTLVADGAAGHPDGPIVVGRSLVFLRHGVAAAVVEATRPGIPRFGFHVLGDADHVLPSGGPEEVWLVHGDPPKPVTLDVVGLGGQRVAETTVLPPNTTPIGPLAGGVLLRRTDDGGSLELFDFQRGTVTAELGVAAEVIATNGALVAWRGEPDGSECDLSGCPPHISVVSTRRARSYVNDQVIVLPPGSSGWIRGGAISPDGKSIAAFVDAGPITEPNGDFGPGAALVIIDVATGISSDPIPGSIVALRGPVIAAAWSSTTDWLFFAGRTGSMHGYHRDMASAIALSAPAPASSAFATN